MGADNQAERVIAKVEWRRVMHHILLRPSLDWRERLQQYSGVRLEFIAPDHTHVRGRSAEGQDLG
jgi:hypothetical protein